MNKFNEARKRKKELSEALHKAGFTFELSENYVLIHWDGKECCDNGQIAAYVLRGEGSPQAIVARLSREFEHA